MLQRKLLYTGMTRGKRLVVPVDQKKAVEIAGRNVSGRRRWSKLKEWLVALSEASAEAGCMEVLSSRGNPRQMPHAALGLANSINGGGQAIVDEIDPAGGTTMALPAGSFSLHHTLCRHRSPPNQAAHRRVGIGISYIPAHCRLTGSVRMCARLARGSDTGRHFDLIPPPEGELHPAALVRHETAYRRYRENYAEQIAVHDREFATAPT